MVTALRSNGEAREKRTDNWHSDPGQKFNNCGVYLLANAEFAVQQFSSETMVQIRRFHFFIPNQMRKLISTLRSI